MAMAFTCASVAICLTDVGDEINVTAAILMVN
jgi:hypothetical protein